MIIYDIKPPKKIRTKQILRPKVSGSDFVLIPKIYKSVFHRSFSFLLILCLVFGNFLFEIKLAVADGTTYYVDCNAAAGGDGSISTPWDAVADVNATAFSPDDQILFAKGCTFREQLTVPSSGTSGHPIIFGAYGSGNDPIFNGADLVTGWTAQSGNAPSLSDGFETGDSDLATDGDGAFWTGAGSPTATLVGNETTTKKTGTYAARATWTAATQGALAYHAITQANSNYVQVAINVGSMTANAGNSAQIRLTSYNNGGSSMMANVIYVNSTTYKLNLAFSNTSGQQTLTGTTVLNVGTWYTIEAYYKANDATTGGAQYWINGTSEGSSLNNNTTQANSQPNRAYIGLNYAGSGFTSGTIYLDDYKYNTSYIGPTFANVYQTNLAYTPSQIFVDGVHGTNKSSLGALTTNNDWYFSGGVLYIYSSTDPSTKTIEAANRTRTILVNGKNYITLQNLQTIYSNTSTEGSIYINNSSAVTVDHLTVHDNDGFAGIYREGTGNSNTIENSTIYNTRHTTSDRGVGIILDGSGGYHTVSGNIVHDNNAAGIKMAMWTASSNNTITGNTIYNNGAGGISVNTGCASNTFSNNVVYQNGQLNADYFGIDLYKVGNNNIVKNNVVHDQHYISLSSGGIRFDAEPGGVFGTGNVIYGNIVYNEREGIYILGADGAAIYNNSVYNSSANGIHVHGSDADGNIVKNNIVHTATTHLIYNQDATNSVIDYNLYYPDGATAFDYTGSISNFASWKTNSGQDAHSTTNDPKFTNAGANDFSLLSTSPAIDTGTSLGDTYKLGLNPNSVWPSAVNTLDQTLNGPGWEIGAYVYSQSSVPTVSISAPSAGAIYGSVAVTATAGATAPATISSVQFYLDGVALQSPVVSLPYTITWDTSTATNASHTLTAVATDNYGNTTTSAGVVVTVDNLGPTGTISNGNGTPTNSTTPTFNLTIADAGVGVTGAQMQFSCDNATWSTWEAYATPKTNFNVRTGEGCTDTDGSKTVYVKYKDSLGNVGSSYDTGAFTLDTASSNAALSGTPASITNSTSASITVAGTDITAYKYKLDSGAYSAEIAVATPISLSSLSDASHTLSVIGKDSAGNWQAEGGATAYTWTVDTTAPVVTFTIPATSDSLTVTFTAFSATDANTITGYLVNETATTPDVSDAGWSGTAQTQYVFSTEGAKTLYAWSKDEAGNISTSGSGSVTITTTHTITASSGANGSITPSGSVSVNNGSDQAFTFTPSSGYHINTVTADGGAVSATSPYTFTNVTADHTISATFAADAVVVSSGGGGGGGGCVGCWVPPTTPTGGFNISINQNASTTSNRIVTLNFNAGTDVKKIAISMTGDFADSSQEDYQATKQWDLCSKFGGLIKNPTCSDGTYKVYVKFFTSYGVSSPIASSSIVLKTDTVSNPNSNPNPDSIQPTTSVTQNSNSFQFTKTLQPGSNNNEVKELQNFLKQLGFFPQEIKSNGNFGPTTKQAVMKYQKSVGLYPEGVVGSRTRKALNNQEFVTNKDYQFINDLKYGDTGEEVKQLQTRLRDRSFFPYWVSSTGWFGPVTQNAVSLFQKFYNLFQSGDINEETRNKLNQ